MPDLACERCGRRLGEDARCVHHPGALGLDLARPSDREFVESLATLRRQRAWRLAGAVSVFAVFAVGFWALARGHDTSTLFTGRSLAAEGTALLLLGGTLVGRWWVERRSSKKSERASPVTGSVKAQDGLLGAEPQKRTATASDGDRAGRERAAAAQSSGTRAE